MGLAIVHSRARVGVRAPEVRVEVHLAGGLPAMSIVGLPEAAVREAKDRVRSAIQCAQFEFPARRITINLAPADLPKHGGRFDLAIALGILAASGQLSNEALDGWEFLGELALTGEIRAVDGVLRGAPSRPALRSGSCWWRPRNGCEAALATGVEVRTARTLLEVCAALDARKALPLATPRRMPAGAATGPGRRARAGAGTPRAGDRCGRCATTCCSSVRPAAARPCWPRACAGSCRKQATPKHWTRRSFVRSADTAWTRRAGASVRSAIRTTPPARWPWSAAAPIRARARSRWPTTACCSWTNCPNGAGMRWKCCASRWNRAASPFRAPRANANFPRASSWSRR